MGCLQSKTADPADSRQVPEKGEETLEKRDKAELVLRKFIEELPEEQKNLWSSQKEETKANLKKRGSKMQAAISWFRRGSTQDSSRKSQEFFRDRSQTLIIFDWDDTIFPTHWFKQERKKAKVVQPSIEDCLIIEELCQAVIDLLNISMEHGHPVMITNSRRPWVDLSSWKVFKSQQLTKVLKEIPILYATEFVDLQTSSQDVEDLKKTLETKGHDMQAGSRQENNQAISAAFLTNTKAKAMKEALQAFYASYDNQSWKNIVSLGDAHFEHDAIKKVVQERPEHMQGKPCRVKTLKFIEAPTLEGILNEIRIATRWISKVCDLDDSVDIDMGNCTIEDLHKTDDAFASLNFSKRGSMQSTYTYSSQASHASTGGQSSQSGGRRI